MMESITDATSSCTDEINLNLKNFSVIFLLI